ncbi:methyltransferase domain-containing protein [Natroniella acetigena]|uniref:class I SAM-dependent methyltransferase n=1 Tax=Natroniella acetigena TaxID=52004 RepID=UPI00200A72AD|nr:class I SAM-dependent methyltransferase [Natroniella acetigena]MCK8826796.1 methyltransferase domain-containing protein [Natroniella acetigena]
MKQDLKQAVEFSHSILTEQLQAGANVIDATVGNGNDTEFLAELVGAEGQVWGFDIQSQAIETTKDKLAESELLERVTLIQVGHQKLGQYISAEIDGILFNLGYLPGADKEVTTTVETTLQAVKAGLERLVEGGVMVIVIYTGHQAGKEEAEALLEYAQGLNYKEYNVLHYHFINQASKPPEALVIKKRG